MGDTLHAYSGAAQKCFSYRPSLAPNLCRFDSDPRAYNDIPSLAVDFALVWYLFGYESSSDIVRP